MNGIAFFILQSSSFRLLQPCSLQSVDLDDDAVLDGDRHLTETQALQGLFDLFEGLLKRPVIPVSWALPRMGLVCPGSVVMPNHRDRSLLASLDAD